MRVGEDLKRNQCLKASFCKQLTYSLRTVPDAQGELAKYMCSPSFMTCHSRPQVLDFPLSWVLIVQALLLRNTCVEILKLELCSERNSLKIGN